MTVNTRDSAAIIGTMTMLAIYIAGTAMYKHFFVITVGVVPVVYLIATKAVQSDEGTERFVTGFCRGLLIGTNGAANFYLFWLVFSNLGLGAAAPTVATLVAALNLLACIGAISRLAIYKAGLGWASWLMPMSWPILALGLTSFVLSLFLHVLGILFKSDRVRIGIKEGPMSGRTFKMDWGTGTLFTHGGLIASLNSWKTAFSMGNFAFVHQESTSSYIPHEAGHTLNLAAFGSLIHIVGAVDQMFAGDRAFAELLANSNDPAGRARLLMW